MACTGGPDPCADFSPGWRSVDPVSNDRQVPPLRFLPSALSDPHCDYVKDATDPLIQRRGESTITANRVPHTI